MIKLKRQLIEDFIINGIMTDKNTILIVDDEPVVIKLTKKFLELGDFTIITCNSGNAAMETLEKHYNEIGMVLLDIMMPGKSGYSVLKEIKANEEYDHIQVILFSVKSFTEDMDKGRALGADGYITKPFSGTDLIKYIKERLNK